MAQTIDNQVSQTAFSQKSGSFFSWGLLMMSLVGGNVLLFMNEPIAPYQTSARESVLRAGSFAEKARPMLAEVQADATGIDRAMTTLKDLEHRQEAMRLFNAAKSLELAEKDLPLLERTMQEAGFSDAYIADFMARKRAEMGVNNEDDTAEFAKNIAKDIVREEVNSLAYRIELLGRVGGFVLRKVQAD